MPLTHYNSNFVTTFLHVTILLKIGVVYLAYVEESMRQK